MERQELKNELIEKCRDIYKNCYQILKFKYPDILDEIMLQTNYLSPTHPFKERIYHIISNIFTIPLCKLCQSEATFRSIKNGYSLYCGKCYHKDPEFRKRVKENNIKTYQLKENEIREKIKKTNVQRYGVKDPNQLQLIKERIKKTNLQRYGVEYNQQNQEVKEKTCKTNMKKRGVRCSFQSEDVKKKIKKTNLQKYGVEHNQQSKKIRDKYKITMIKKYGVDNPSKINKVMSKIQIALRISFLEKFKIMLHSMNFELEDNKYINNITQHKWKCLKCGTIFEENWRNMCRGYLCPSCYPRYSGSIPQKEISEFINELGIKSETNNRKIIFPKELDILVEEKKIAIEFDGLYYHSEIFNTDFNYHLNKTILCEEKGYRLIHIFEDEWIFKKEIIKSVIKNVLHKNDSTRIHGRECKIKEISPSDKNKFLNKYHMLGEDKSVIKLGAFFNDELVSIMTFSHGNISKGTTPKKDIWELNRFCSNYNYHIPGIASKILSYFKKNYEWKTIFSYADRRWSTGNMYYKLGFRLVSKTPVNYWYINGYKRIHRYNLRKRKDEPKNVTEVELRLQEGYIRIWDCGSLKFSLENNGS